MGYISMISAILAVIISATTVFNTFKKPYKDLEKKEDEEIKRAISELYKKIEENQNETKKDIYLLKKLVITMADELETKNHVNGKTEKVLEEVKNDLYNN